MVISFNVAIHGYYTVAEKKVKTARVVSVSLEDANALNKSTMEKLGKFDLTKELLITRLKKLNGKL